MANRTGCSVAGAGRVSAHVDERRNHSTGDEHDARRGDDPSSRHGRSRRPAVSSVDAAEQILDLHARVADRLQSPSSDLSPDTNAAAGGDSAARQPAARANSAPS